MISALHRHCHDYSRFDSLPHSGPLYIAGIDNDADCASERACKWKRFAAVVRSTCSGSERTCLRILCTPSCAPSSPTANSVAPHCIQITILPEPIHAPSHIELLLRWIILVIRESRASNASCLVSLLGYMSALIRLENMKISRTHLRPSHSVSDFCDPKKASSSLSENSSALTSRYTVDFASAAKTHTSQSGHLQDFA